jgi:hypothetical protein
MPVYQFHGLPEGDTPPTKIVLFNDGVAGRIALSPQFPDGCDVWQGTRFVGRFHRPASEGSEKREAEA